MNDDFNITLKKTLKNWSGNINKVICKTTDKYAKKLVKILKEKSPRGKRQKYHKKWKSEVNTKNFLDYEKIVYVSGNEYRLAHLLENGHALRRGGRTVGKVAASPHIKPAKEQIEKEYIAEIKTAIEKEN